METKTCMENMLKRIEAIKGGDAYDCSLMVICFNY